jgi:hypothetical protein
MVIMEVTTEATITMDTVMVMAVKAIMIMVTTNLTTLIQDHAIEQALPDLTPAMDRFIELLEEVEKQMRPICQEREL